MLVFVIDFRDMPGQAELLVKRMKSNSNIDFDNDWKIITLFVGGNDLCDFCEDKVIFYFSCHINISYKFQINKAYSVKIMTCLKALLKSTCKNQIY